MTQWIVLHPVEDPAPERLELAAANIHGPFYEEEDANARLRDLGDMALLVRFEPIRPSALRG